jgi:TM2 domain-containing membrane protein YozV
VVRRPNFYLGRTGVAITQLILTLTVIGWIITIIWVFIDGFLIPSWVRRENNQLAARLGA